MGHGQTIPCFGLPLGLAWGHISLRSRGARGALHCELQIAEMRYEVLVPGRSTRAASFLWYSGGGA